MLSVTIETTDHCIDHTFFTTGIHTVIGACDNNITQSLKSTMLASTLCVGIVIVCGQKVFMVLGLQTRHVCISAFKYKTKCINHRCC